MNTHQSNNTRTAMKLLSLIGATALSLFALAGTPAVASAEGSGGFTASCSSIGSIGTLVLASCTKQDGSQVRAQIELNPFIGNADGALVFSFPQFGGFGSSCRDIAVSEQGVLQATCSNAANNAARFTRLNLNEHITNINGELGFN